MSAFSSGTHSLGSPGECSSCCCSQGGSSQPPNTSQYKTSLGSEPQVSTEGVGEVQHRMGLGRIEPPGAINWGCRGMLMSASPTASKRYTLGITHEGMILRRTQRRMVRFPLTTMPPPKEPPHSVGHACIIVCQHIGTGRTLSFLHLLHQHHHITGRGLSGNKCQQGPHVTSPCLLSSEDH